MKPDSQSLCVQVTFQWDLVSLLAASGNLPRWRLSRVGIKNVYTERRGGKKIQTQPNQHSPTVAQVKLCPGETQAGWPFPWLPWRWSFIASAAELPRVRAERRSPAELWPGVPR